MTIWFTADTHFNHEGIITYCNRPFDGVRDMNDALIELWNDVVGKTDDVWVLGDFAFKHPQGYDLDVIFGALKGRKHLVRGNHDERNPKVLRLPWEKQVDLGYVRQDKMRAVVCHYPLETWKNAQRGSLMLHGHSHGTLQRVIPHRFDMGVDVECLAPVPFEAIWARSQQQEFKAVDHQAL